MPCSDGWPSAFADLARAGSDHHHKSPRTTSRRKEGHTPPIMHEGQEYLRIPESVQPAVESPLPPRPRLLSDHCLPICLSSLPREASRHFTSFLLSPPRSQASTPQTQSRRMSPSLEMTESSPQ